MTLIKILAEIEIYNQMLKKRECASHHVFVHVEKEHVTLSIENAQDNFKFFRMGAIEDLHIKIPATAIKGIAEEIVAKEKKASKRDVS